MAKRDAVSQVAALVAVSCALITTGLVVRREFFRRPASSASTEPRFIADWQEYLRGHVLGPPDAPVKIIEFSDFQCPWCRRFAVEALKPLRARYPDAVALFYRHWPLERHAHAYSAARASECAANQGRFQQFHDALFDDQAAIGVKSFGEFANIAGVPDLEQFDRCAESSSRVMAIEEDILAAKRLGGTGTR